MIVRDINYKLWIAKKVFVTLTNMSLVDERELAKEYRRKLSNLLAN